MSDKGKESASERMERIVAETRRMQDERELTYREQALKLYPWVCGRCGREFDRSNLRELTVHHRDHNHDNNPEDGSNWELLCLYCHDNEHSRYLDHEGGVGLIDEDKESAGATHNPFASLKDMLKGSE